MRLPSSWKISTASWHHTPVTSHANGANMWFLANSSYLAVLSRAARSAAAPAWTDVSGRYDTANVSATVTSYAMFLLRPHGTIEAPSGRLLAMEPSFFLNEKQRPVGSFWACIFARLKERQIASFRRLCRTCLPFPSADEAVMAKGIDFASTDAIVWEAHRSSNPQPNSDAKLLILKEKAAICRWYCKKPVSWMRCWCCQHPRTVQIWRAYWSQMSLHCVYHQTIPRMLFEQAWCLNWCRWSQLTPDW